MRILQSIKKVITYILPFGLVLFLRNRSLKKLPERTHPQTTLHRNLPVPLDYVHRDMIVKTFPHLFQWRQRYGIIFGSLVVGLITYIIIRNFDPFGVHIAYSSDGDWEEVLLTPTDRIEKLETSEGKIMKITNALVYFTTPWRMTYDFATAQVIFRPTSENQEIQLGFKNDATWSYKMYALNTPYLNSLKNGIGTGPFLYQKEKNYSSADEFLKNPPRDALIGVYDFDIPKEWTMGDVPPDYKPTNANTVIASPLRGKHTMYVYMKNEPFQMKIQKQDLNWYIGPDTLKITIYKNDDVVFEDILPDDGITDSSNSLVTAQETVLKNPGPELPEAGVYKIVLDGPADVIIKRIETNLSKVVFEGPIFLAGNKDVYGKVVTETRPSTLYTDALLLKAQTVHDEGLQTISVGEDQEVEIEQVNWEKTIVPETTPTTITSPKNDISLSGLGGFFSFSKEQYFRPTPLRIIPIKNEVDVALSDYVLTEYSPPKATGDGWFIATKRYPLDTAVPTDDSLSWLIRSHGLEAQNNAVLIKDIRIVLSKKPVFEQKE